ncbi:MAG: S1 RNA-binding domain-containing protein, partial [Planctomycetes bacterium]|nr:S1 RNA-binding domain-containing protein [Planctomycetota bacterium]
METQLGEEFGGIITGVRNFGMFVRLDKILIEGLIPLGTLEDDYYHVDEQRYTATGRNTGRVFRMGDAVTVQVARVDPSSKQVDFHLVSTEKPTGRRRAKPKPGPKTTRKTGRPGMSKPKAKRGGRRKGSKA